MLKIGFNYIKCFTFITQNLEGHKNSSKIRIAGSNGLKLTAFLLKYEKYKRNALNLTGKVTFPLKK